MNGRNHEELLSAYHDGELAAAECADVEQRLAEDESARDALEELCELSRVLAECPKSPAPDDFCTAVMQQVRSAAPVRTARPVSPARPSRRYWVWSAATVAGLFLAVLMFQHVWIGNAPVGGVAGTEQAARPMRGATSSPAAPHRDALSAPAAEDAAADTPPATAMEPADAAADLHDLEAAVTSGSPPQIGETLKRLVRDGEELRIVQYTVLDISKAFGQMQVLLEENGIRTIAPDGTSTLARPPQSGELLAIVVEASDDKLDGALTAMGGDRSVRGVLRRELSDVTRFPLEEEPSAGTESLQPPPGAPREIPPKPAAAEPPPAERAPEPAAPQSAATRAEADADIAVPIGVPLTLEQMQSMLPIESAQQQDRTRRQGSGESPVRSQAQDTARKPADAPAAPLAPRTRILIVLVPERTGNP